MSLDEAVQEEKPQAPPWCAEDVFIKLKADLSWSLRIKPEPLDSHLVACHLVLLSAQGLKQHFSKYGPGITSEGIPTVCGGVVGMLVRTSIPGAQGRLMESGPVGKGLRNLHCDYFPK